MQLPVDPLALGFGVGRDEPDIIAAVGRARGAASVADFVHERVREQAVFALLRKDYSIRQIAATLDLPKSEIGRIAKRVAARGDVDLSEPVSIMILGGRAAAFEGVKDAWRRHGGEAAAGGTTMDAPAAADAIRRTVERGGGSVLLEIVRDHRVSAIGQLTQEPLVAAAVIDAQAEGFVVDADWGSMGMVVSVQPPRAGMKDAGDGRPS